MRHIESKAEFYDLSRRLLMGNRLQQWTRAEFYEIWMSAGRLTLPAYIGVRHVGAAFRGKSMLLPRDRACAYASQNPTLHLLFDEGAAHERLTLQGEIMATERGLYLRYSHMRVHQRVLWVLDSERGDIVPDRGPLVRHAFELRASCLLQKYMDDNSWECVNGLLREFTYPVIEFACFDGPVGVMGWNTLIWEVRTKF